MGGVCDLCRDHGAHCGNSAERHLAREHRRAVPLAFLLASIAIAIVSYSFIRLTSYFNHAGSAYALAGVMLGPRVGFFACWALLGTYSAFLAANFAEIGLFGESFFSGIGIGMALLYPGLARKIGIGLAESEDIRAPREEGAHRDV